MFSCGLCQEEYLLYSRLCPKCDKIYKLGKIYGWDTIYNIIDKCLVIPKVNQDKKLDNTIKSVGNDNDIKVIVKKSN